MSKLIQSESTQRLGIVAIVYNVGPVRSGDQIDFDRLRNTSRLIESLPFRFAALHYCLNDPALHSFAALAMSILTTQARLRFRMHFGTKFR